MWQTPRDSRKQEQTSEKSSSVWQEGKSLMQLQDDNINTEMFLH